MTVQATDALVDALEAATGLPVPTSREYAARVEHQLAARGYEIVRRRPSPTCVCLGPNWPHVPSSIRCTPSMVAKPRIKACVEAWPDCESGAYNPSCCRFPKSCSCTSYDEEQVTEEYLEQQTGVTAPYSPASDGGDA